MNDKKEVDMRYTDDAQECCFFTMISPFARKLLQDLALLIWKNDSQSTIHA